MLNVRIECACVCHCAGRMGWDPTGIPKVHCSDLLSTINKWPAGESGDSSQTNSFFEFWIFNLRLGFLGFWDKGEFWGGIVTDSANSPLVHKQHVL